jgi:hypothetical protein
LIVRPWDKARVKWLKEQDAKILDYQKKNDAVAKRVRDLLGGLDGKRDRKVVAGYRGILEKLTKLRSLHGKPFFVPQRGRPHEPRSFMEVWIALLTLRVLQSVAARCGVRLQHSFGKEDVSLIVPEFTLAMMRLILPGVRLPSPPSLLRTLKRAFAFVEGSLE